VFALGLFPDGALRKTELAAREYQRVVSGAPATLATPESAP
jgi:hypothetical protein